MTKLLGFETDSAEYRSLKTHVADGFVEDRCLESSLAVSTERRSRHFFCLYVDLMLNLCLKLSQESSSSLERPDIDVHDPNQEQEQPSPISVLERIHLEDETVSPGNMKTSKLGIVPGINEFMLFIFLDH